LGTFAILGEVVAPGFGEVISLLASFNLNVGLTDFFKVSERRVDHPGTWNIEPVRKLFQRLDELIAMGGIFLKQGEQDELEIGRRKLPAGAKLMTSTTSMTVLPVRAMA
jgi:hypothetical protein